MYSKANIRINLASVNIPRLLMVSLAYFIFGWLGLKLAIIGSTITLIWLPTGIAVAALFRWGLGYALAVWLGALAINMAIGSSWWIALGISLGNTLAPIVSVALLRRWYFKHSISSWHDVPIFFVSGALGMMLSASGGVLVLLAGDLLPTSALAWAWLTWWLGDTVGVIVGGMALVTFEPKAFKQLLRGKQRKEFLASALAVTAVSLVLIIMPIAPINHFVSTPLVVLSLVWIALRLDAWTAATATLIISMCAAIALITGHGHLSQQDVHFAIAELWTYISTLSIVTMLVSAFSAERKQIEQALRESEHFFQSLAHVNPIGIYRSDASGQCLFVNHKWCEITGMTRQQAQGEGWHEAIMPEDRDRVYNEWTTAVQQRRLFTLEYRFQRANGDIIWVYGLSTPIRDAQDNILGYVGTLTDITERKQAEMALQQTQADLQEAQRVAQLGSWHWDVANDIVSWSDGLYRLYACDKHTPPPNYEDSLQLYTPESGQRINTAVENALQSGMPYQIDLELNRTDGIKQWVVARGEVVRDSNGQIIALRGTVQDITERKQAEELLEMMRFSVDYAGDSIFWISREGRILYANNAACEERGYLAAEMLDMNIFDLDPDYQEGVWAIHFEDLKQRGTMTLETRHRTKDGLIYPIEVNANYVNINHHEFNFCSLRNISKRKQMEQAVKASQQRLNDIIDLMPIAVFIKDAQSRLIKMNSACEALWGISFEQLRDTTGRHIFPPEQIERFLAADKKIFADGELFEIEEFVWNTQLQTNRIVHTYKKPVFNDAGQPEYLIGIGVDITDHKRIETELRIAAIAFESQEGMIVSDANNHIIRVNHAFTEITGYSADEVIGKNPKLLQSGRHDAAFYSAMWDAILDKGVWEGEIWDKRKNGEIYPTHIIITSVKNQDGKITNYVSTFNDISVSKAAADEIERLAFYDPLTKLPNRRLLFNRLQQALAASHRNALSGSLLFIDMDNFKNLNDTLGHEMGDMLLQQVAQRLQFCVRENDTIARLGGDEFVVLLEDLANDMAEAAIQTEVVGKKILLTLSQLYALKSHEYRSTPSIGAVLFSGYAQSADELIRQADIAMYQAKASGRNTLRFFNPQMQATIMARSALKKELELAIEKNQFRLYYQPQVYQNRHITGAEALIRWQHPKQGLISPTTFISLAEESDLILLIGHWVLETACYQLKNWANNEQTQHLQLAVNVSARQFRHPDFVTQVTGLITCYGINPTRLKLELTESMALDNVVDTIEKMNALRNVGVRFSMDDFGTGYSSLSNLRKLPIEQLKIDQSFVRDISTDADDAVIVQTIIAMAKNLGLKIIAEGVETEAQCHFLQQHGCQNFQGYLFSKPVPIEQFEALLTTITH